MKNILVSGACGLLGYGILQSLRRSETPYRLIGSTIYDYNDSVAPKFCDIVVRVPLTLSEGFIDWILHIIAEYKIDLIIPGFEIDVTFWGKHYKLLEQTGAKVVLNNPDLISLCDDKWEFHKVMKKNNSPFTIPSSLCSDLKELEREFGMPLLLKPRKGMASRGIVKVDDLETFNKHKVGIGKQLMVQPFIGKDDEEFTTAAFCDGNGGYYAIITFKRQLSKEGYTTKAEVLESKQIEKAVLDLCRIFKPIGPTNFQFRIHNGVYHLLEVNPRFSSSTSIRSAFGYNDAKMAVDYYLEGKPPKQPKIRMGKAIRYIEDHIFFS